MISSMSGEVDRYLLAQMTIGDDKGIVLHKSEYDQIASAIEAIRHLIDIEEKFDCVAENYREFEETILSLTLNEMITPLTKNLDFDAPRKLIARRLMNFLASVRLYLDSIDHHVKALLNDEPNDSAEMHAVRAEQYDQFLAYRTLEALRNYAQHRALPVHGFTVGRRKVFEGDNMQLVYEVSPRVNVKTLAEDNRFKRSVLAELQALSKEPDLKAFVRIYMECLGRVHRKLRELTIEPAKSSLSSIDKFVGLYHAVFPEVENLVSLAAVPVDRHGHSVGKEIYLTGPMKEYLTFSRERVGSMVNFAKRTIAY